MFKNSEEEHHFNAVLSAYKSEYGCTNVIVYLPKLALDCLSEEHLASTYAIRFWNRNGYGIRVRDGSARFDLQPED